jgi:integrase
VKREDPSGDSKDQQQFDTWEQRGSAASDAAGADLVIGFWTHKTPLLGQVAGVDVHLLCEPPGQSGAPPESILAPASTTLAAFVEQKFIPEYVAVKTSAGRAHFRSILKHVLTPELVNRAFGVHLQSPIISRRPAQDWPYMDGLQLSGVRSEDIRHLIAIALERGYSTQTVIHIRNVIRAVFSHASKTSIFSGPNPAALVVPPSIIRREAHALTLDEWKRVVKLMHYPEREIALFATVIGMSVAEICGLQWKYVNCSPFRRLVDREWISCRTIAIRNQSYRGQFCPVLENRRRMVPVPDLICSVLQSLRARIRFTGPEDFILTSRSGTPVNQDNLAERRLKSIGESVEMPWLSWQVFHRTHCILSEEFGRKLESELNKALESTQSCAVP